MTDRHRRQIRSIRGTAAGSQSKPSPPKKAARWRAADQDDEIIFAACYYYLGPNRMSVVDIGRRLNEEFGRTDINRERVIPLIRRGIALGFATLTAPLEFSVAQRIADVYDLPKQWAIHVVNTKGPRGYRYVAKAAAKVLHSLIKKVAADQGRDRVHIGFGVGRTTKDVAKYLGDLIRSDPECPNLTVHALSSAGFLENPPDGARIVDAAPINFVHFLNNGLNRVEFVGLNTPAVVPWDEYDDFRRGPAMQEALRRASEIDVVFTAFASAGHLHGVLNHYLRHLESADPHDVTRQLLINQGWVGDIQYVPYSKTGPITLQGGSRSVVLLEIPDLLRMAQSGDKHVVLAGGPCSQCGATRTEALQPLIDQPRLRAWSHLVTDLQTAYELLPPKV